MGNSGSAENDGDGQQRNREPPRNGFQIDEALAAGALIGTAAGGLLYWAFGDSDKTEKDQSATPRDRGATLQGPPPIEESSVRQKTYLRGDGQVVTGVYIDCQSQAEAFRAAMAKDKQKRRPVLHPPHGEDCDESLGGWHYHPFTHDVWEGNRLMDYHYIFPSIDKQRILATDTVLREEY